MEERFGFGGIASAPVTPRAKWGADNILGARFGEANNKITVEFKKTIFIRNYETEVFDLSSEITLDNSVDGIDRMLVTCILQAQLELQCFGGLLIRNKITQQEYNDRKEKILLDVNMTANRYEKITGRDSGKYLELIQNRS